MKTLKKAMSVLVSLLMIFTFALPAFADSATTYTITAPATTHQYEIYQIFTGDLSEGILSNVKWGVNGTGTVGKAVDSTIITELTDVNSKSDREKLDVVERYAKLDSTPVETISNGATYSAVAGYYLIKDKDNTVSGTDTYTTYIVQVVGDVTITPKSNVPSFEKKVKDTMTPPVRPPTGRILPTTTSAMRFPSSSRARLPATMLITRPTTLPSTIKPSLALLSTRIPSRFLWTPQRSPLATAL